MPENREERRAERPQSLHQRADVPTADVADEARGRLALLEIHDLHAHYGESHVLHGVDMTVPQCEVVSLLGRNGAGKTTTLRAIMGILDSHRGSISLAGREISHLSSDRIARLGIAYCPEERGIFASLDVEENLLLPPAVRPGGMSLDEVYQLFPNLRERRRSQGTRLSGGEQQMLAIGRILRTGAKLLLLDEPTEGLAPVIVQQIGEVIRRLKDTGFTILMVEQNFKFATTVSDSYYVMDQGRIVEHLPHSELHAKLPAVQKILGV